MKTIAEQLNALQDSGAIRKPNRHERRKAAALERARLAARKERELPPTVKFDSR